MKCYSLNCYFKGKPRYKGSEILLSNSKRSVIMSHKTLKELDNLTSKFESLEDMNLELNKLYNSDLNMDSLVIIADPNDEDFSKSYFINDIVYLDDKKMIDDYDGIKAWTYNFLIDNPDKIHYFNGIRNIWKNKYSHLELNEFLIRKIVFAYFVNYNYKKVRDAYFTLKFLNEQRDKKNEVHR